MTQEELVFLIEKKKKTHDYIFNSLGGVFIIIGLGTFISGLFGAFEDESIYINYFISILGLVFASIYIVLFYKEYKNPCRTIELIKDKPEEIKNILFVKEKRSGGSAVSVTVRLIVLIDNYKKRHSVYVSEKYYPELIRILYDLNPKIKMSQKTISEIKKHFYKKWTKEQVQLFEYTMNQYMLKA